MKNPSQLTSPERSDAEIARDLNAFDRHILIEAECERLRAALRLADLWLNAAEVAGKIGGDELAADRAQIKAALDTARDA